MRVEHVALWVRDLERARSFYVEHLGGRSGPVYENPRTGFRSYFVCFEGGARLELMQRPDRGPAGDATSPTASSERSAVHRPVANEGSGASDATAARMDDRHQGYAHVAFAVASRSAVDATVARLEAAGVTIAGRPRVTGDGYYEAVIEDPEGNLLELVAEAVSGPLP